MQIPAGKAPIKPLSQLCTWTAQCEHWPRFTKQFNARTADQGDLIIPVVITVYADRSFSFRYKDSACSVLIKKACNIKSVSSHRTRIRVATLSKAKLQEIAELKMPDLNAASLSSYEHDHRNCKKYGR